jgi:hypothetical protein
VWFTAAFGVSKDLIEPIAKMRNQMRFVLMEKPAPEDQKKRLTAKTTPKKASKKTSKKKTGKAAKKKALRR